MHSGTRLWRCPFEGCGRRLGYATNLYAHMRIHTGERPYVCQLEGCTKRFRQRAHLNAHQLTHMRPDRGSLKSCGQIPGPSGSRATDFFRSHGLAAAAPCRLTAVSSLDGRRRLDWVVRRLWRQSGLDRMRHEQQMMAGEKETNPVADSRDLLS